MFPNTENYNGKICFRMTENYSGKIGFRMGTAKEVVEDTISTPPAQTKGKPQFSHPSSSSCATAGVATVVAAISNAGAAWLHVHVSPFLHSPVVLEKKHVLPSPLPPPSAFAGAALP